MIKRIFHDTLKLNGTKELYETLTSVSINQVSLACSHTNHLHTVYGAFLATMAELRSWEKRGLWPTKPEIFIIFHGKMFADIWLRGGQDNSYINTLLLFSHPVMSDCDPMDGSTPGLPVPHHLLKFTQVHVHCISEAIQPSHPLTLSSPSALNRSSRTFPVSQLFASDDQNTGASASASVLPMSIQG